MTPHQAYCKARESGKRIPELEPIISKDAYLSCCYAFVVIKGRWELAEPAISKDAKCSYYYAKYVIKGKLPDFMHNQMILENNEYARKYIKFISKNPDSSNNKI